MEVEKFFGCYLLYSLNEKYKGRTYIGFTVDPNRRIKQHNRGLKAGGAWKTNNKGPWDMILIVHGFPTDVAALRFEWAWQNPLKSRRLRHVSRKLPRENALKYRFRVMSEMLRVGPWNRLPLTVQWLNITYKQDFDVSKLPPLHIPICVGPIVPQKVKDLKEEEVLKFCFLCHQVVTKDKRFICFSKDCKEAFHVICLGKYNVSSQSEKNRFLLPVDGTCPNCNVSMLWGDVIRYVSGCYQINQQTTSEVPAEMNSHKRSEKQSEESDLVTPETYEKYLQQSIIIAESEAQNNFHCKTPDCPGFCLLENAANFFLCSVCKHTNCLTCSAIHEGKNCQQFQDDVAIKCNSNEDARKTTECLENEIHKGTEAEFGKKTDYQNLQALNDINLVQNVDQFECPICFSDIDVGEGVILQECLHNFCRGCIASTIQFSEDAKVKCPFQNDEYKCESYLREREVKSIVSSDIYEKYLQRSITLAESQAQNSFHCKTPDCLGWCLFEDAVNFFKCPVCEHTNCLTCDAIHEGKNCKQYQDDAALSSGNSEEAKKTKEYLQSMLDGGKAMRCPQCQVIIVKKGGCRNMTCSICYRKFTWIHDEEPSETMREFLEHLRERSIQRRLNQSIPLPPLPTLELPNLHYRRNRSIPLPPAPTLELPNFSLDSRQLLTSDVRSTSSNLGPIASALEEARQLTRSFTRENYNRRATRHRKSNQAIQAAGAQTAHQQDQHLQHMQTLLNQMHNTFQRLQRQQSQRMNILGDFQTNIFSSQPHAHTLSSSLQQTSAPSLNQNDPTSSYLQANNQQRRPTRRQHQPIQHQNSSTSLQQILELPDPDISRRQLLLPSNVSSALSSQERISSALGESSNAVIKASEIGVNLLRHPTQHRHQNSSTSLQQALDLSNSYVSSRRLLLPSDVSAVSSQEQIPSAIEEAQHISSSSLRGRISPALPKVNKRKMLEEISKISKLIKSEIYEKPLQPVESKAQNRFHCKTLLCDGWCFLNDTIDNFLCPICKHTNCLICAAIHEGKSCKEFQRDVACKSINSDEDKKEKEYLKPIKSEIYEKHLQPTENKSQDRFHCKTLFCDGWCFFDGTTDIFMCPLCKHTNCITCAAIHEGKNCKEFQRDLASL